MVHVMTSEVSDPRPVVDGRVVVGARCAVCGHASAWRVERCERCRGACRPVAHGPGGVVWASALVHLQVGDRTPPFLLAYVDLAGSDGMPGPRVLARVVAEAELPPGTPVAITRTDGGDIVVEAVLVSPEDCGGPA